jgi:hypothetical protein
MNVIVNPTDVVMFGTNPSVPKGFVIVATENGFHYISNDQTFFVPRSQAEELMKKEEVRKIFGLEE